MSDRAEGHLGSSRDPRSIDGEGDILDRKPGSTAESAPGWWKGVSSRAPHMALVMIIGVAIGVVIGAVGFGGLGREANAPSEPADLAPDGQAQYVQLVADLYQREERAPDRVARARARLRSFSAEQLEAVVQRLTSGQRDPVSAQHVTMMAQDLGISVAPTVEEPGSAPTTAESASAAQGSPPREGMAIDRWTRVGRALAVTVLVAALLGAGALAWAAARWRSGPYGMGRARPERRPRPDGLGPSGGGQASTPAAPSSSEDPDGLEGSGGTTDAGGIVAPSSPRSGRPAPPAAREGDSPPPLAAPWDRSRSRRSTAFRPARIDLDQVAEVRFEEEDDLFQTWLIYDDLGTLLGSAGIKSQRIGSAVLLELWLFERDEEERLADRPSVCILAPAAMDEPVLRARLRDRTLIRATPDRSATIRAGGLRLELDILEVVPATGEDSLSLRSAVLRLQPRRSPVAAPIPDEASGAGADPADGGANAASEGDSEVGRSQRADD